MEVAYTTGPGINFVLIPIGFACFVWLIKCLMNIKKLNEKQYLPIIVMIVLLITVGLLQTYDRRYLIIVTCQTIVTILMFHTIENPDIKMIEALDFATKQAEKANRAKTDFLSSMSHEIRTPLNAIVGFSECIKTETSLDAAQRDADDIIMASQNLLEIVNGILDISKIEADQMEVVNSKYELIPNLENLCKLIKPRIAEKPIEFISNFSDDLPVGLYGDIGKIKQIITNLLTNAAKYTTAGKITFSVSCVNEADQSSLIFSVEDTGRGINPDKVDKLFTKFNRLDEDRNTTAEGTGLGLAITKSLVEMMGGKIVVQSVYGKGSKFTVYLKQRILNQSDDQIKETNGLVLDMTYEDSSV